MKIRILDNINTPYGAFGTSEIRTDLPESFCEQLIRQGKGEKVLDEPQADRQDGDARTPRRRGPTKAEM